MKLSQEQLDFLKLHNISHDQVFDASRYRQKTYRALMKEGGFIVAMGVSRCNIGHHSLRSRSGHCVMCNSASLSFQKRHHDDGDIYVMHSQTTNLVKIGTADSATERLVTLNKQAYGDVKDWELVFSIRVTNSGYAEQLIHGNLWKHNTTRYFFKNGSMVLAQEVFSCTPEHAINTIKEILK